MDGTIVNSIAAAERIWAQWARRHGLDVAAFLPTIHGARAVDTVAKLGLPGIDPEHEAAAITRAEIDDVVGVVEITGATKFLNSLPPSRWAVVTSAPRLLAQARLKAAGLPLPPVLVTAEDVAAGKPKPDCYLLAAQKLGVAASDCLVFEDAPAGIQAGEAAGADVLVITATHAHPFPSPHPSVRDYARLAARLDDDGGLVIG